MKLTIAQAHRLLVSLNAIAKGFPNEEGKTVNVIRTAAAKLSIARNIRKLRETLEVAEGELVSERDRLMQEEMEVTPDARSLSMARTAQLDRFTREVNAETAELELSPIKMADLDIEAFCGTEAIDALSIAQDIIIET